MGGVLAQLDAADFADPEGSAEVTESRMTNKLLIVAFSIQAVSFLLVVYEFVGSVSGIWWRRPSWQVHETIEVLSVLGLLIGFAMSAWLLRKTMNRNRKIEEQLKVAADSFQAVLEEKFETWKLSKAEKDVALMIIKGFSVAEIAEIRQKSEGTIKAQNSSIYQKSGLAGRVQFVSYFLEELTAKI